MQQCMTLTYPMMALEAIKSGFDGAWERLIAAKVLKDFINDFSEAFELMSFVSQEDPAMPVKAAALKVAYLITNSKIPDSVDLGASFEKLKDILK